MQCQCCKNHTATIHLTEINNGQRLETHLCESCAQKQGLAVKNQIPLNELLSTLLAVQPDLKKQLGETEGSAVDTPCPSCGMTLRRFQKEVVLGCPHDYEFFEKSLDPIIKRFKQSYLQLVRRLRTGCRYRYLFASSACQKPRGLFVPHLPERSETGRIAEQIKRSDPFSGP
jgi:protein-arginine kinase activator protein McsA